MNDYQYVNELLSTTLSRLVGGGGKRWRMAASGCGRPRRAKGGGGLFGDQVLQQISSPENARKLAFLAYHGWGFWGFGDLGVRRDVLVCSYNE